MEEQNQAIQPPQTNPDDPVEAKFRAFVEKYKDRIKQWIDAHGNVQIPVIQDKDGNFIWLNREQRRQRRQGR